MSETLPTAKSKRQALGPYGRVVARQRSRSESFDLFEGHRWCSPVDHLSNLLSQFGHRCSLSNRLATCEVRDRGGSAHW